MLEFDQQLFILLNKLLSGNTLGQLFSGVSLLGNGYVLALLIVPTMVWRDRPTFRAHIVPMVVSVSATGALVNIAKILFGRERPPVWAARQGVDIQAVVDLPPDKSFPSGHAQTAFGAAVYLSLLYPRCAGLFLLLALLVGLSRISLGVHFPGDVLVGALVGSGGSILVYWWARRRSSQ